MAASRRHGVGRRRRSGHMPIEDGRSGTSSQTSGSSAAVATETAIATGFQPPCWASAASSGRNTSRPVARTGRHQAHHQAAIGLEPAVDDGGAEHGGDRARADAGQHAPGGDQVPWLGHQQAERRRARHQQQGGDQRAAQRRCAPSAPPRTARPGRRGRCRWPRRARSTSRRQPNASSSGSIITESDERSPAAISRQRKMTPTTTKA